MTRSKPGSVLRPYVKHDATADATSPTPTPPWARTKGGITGGRFLHDPGTNRGPGRFRTVRFRSTPSSSHFHMEITTAHRTSVLAYIETYKKKYHALLKRPHGGRAATKYSRTSKPTEGQAPTRMRTPHLPLDRGLVSVVGLVSGWAFPLFLVRCELRGELPWLEITFNPCCGLLHRKKKTLGAPNGAAGW